MFVSKQGNNKQNTMDDSVTHALCRVFFQFMGLLLIALLQSSSEAPLSSELEGVLTQCVLNLKPLHQFSIGHRLELHILRCFCDCDGQKASQQLWQAKVNYEPQCNARMSSKSGLCIEKFQRNLLYNACPQGGFAHCLIDCKARIIYDVTILEFIKVSKLLTVDERNRIELKEDDNKFRHRNQEYYINGVICDPPPARNFLHFQNKNNDFDHWLETFDYSESNMVLIKKKWIIISNDTETNKHLPLLLEFEDGVCNNDDSSVTPAAPMELKGNGVKVWSGTITKYMKNINVVQIFYESRHAVHPVTHVTTTVSTVKVLPEQTNATSQFEEPLQSTTSTVINSLAHPNQQEQAHTQWQTVIPVGLTVIVVFGGLIFLWHKNSRDKKKRKPGIKQEELKQSEEHLPLSTSR